MRKKLAVLVSGTGSLLEAMIAGGLPIDLVVADRPCRGINEVLANWLGPREILLRTNFTADFDRVAYTHDMIGLFKKFEIDVVAMAGFMTIFSGEMMDAYGGRVLNTHPSLLPAFKGDHAVRDALAAKVALTGCTIHLATAELDEGPILEQQTVTVLPDDTVATLHERIKVVERQLYPLTISKFLQDLG